MLSKIPEVSFTLLDLKNNYILTKVSLGLFYLVSSSLHYMFLWIFSQYILVLSPFAESSWK